MRTASTPILSLAHGLSSRLDRTSLLMTNLNQPGNVLRGQRHVLGGSAIACSKDLAPDGLAKTASITPSSASSATPLPR
ncbi:hypothetical protein AAEZ42_02385 [Limosilactobacillus fermentum]